MEFLQNLSGNNMNQEIPLYPTQTPFMFDLTFYQEFYMHLKNNNCQRAFSYTLHQEPDIVQFLVNHFVMSEREKARKASSLQTPPRAVTSTPKRNYATPDYFDKTTGAHRIMLVSVVIFFYIIRFYTIRFVS